ncbi:PAS domain-containing protein [Paenibacillus taihuensis]|nr:PAS domain-containing protein [Paenibacillus taihuensis]
MSRNVEREMAMPYSIAHSYQRLIKYLPEPIFVHDGMVVLFANQAGLRLLGMSELSEINEESGA